MFTGIIEELGTVIEVEALADAARLTVEGTLITSDASPGDSISVNGCCLTVTDLQGSRFSADVMRETLDKTSLGALVAGSRVNLERSVTPSTRLGGHIVQGHVDGTGQVLSREPSQHWEMVTFSAPRELARYVVAKGSVAIDGVSLTVVDVSSDAATTQDATADDGTTRVTVSLIPETLARTTLGLKQVGDPVNLEVDVIAKYVEKLVVR